MIYNSLFNSEFYRPQSTPYYYLPLFGRSERIIQTETLIKIKSIHFQKTELYFK